MSLFEKKYIYDYKEETYTGFFITMVTSLDNVIMGDFNTYPTSEIVAFEESYEEAEKAVLTNSCDIQDHMFEYALIEEVPIGVYPSAINKWWFKWDRKNKEFFKLPDEERDWCNNLFQGSWW